MGPVGRVSPKYTTLLFLCGATCAQRSSQVPDEGSVQTPHRGVSVDPSSGTGVHCRVTLTSILWFRLRMPNRPLPLKKPQECCTPFSGIFGSGVYAEADRD